MARPLRLEFPGAVYHVTVRGNARQDIFVDDADRQKFLDVLAATVDRYNWRCHAYCLMGNHYHLLLETMDPNLSLGMRMLNGVYTQSFNRRHNRVGHVFQGRYKALLVAKDAHLLELCRYIVLNPVAAGMVKQPEQWPWSSYHGTVAKGKRPAFLVTDWVLGQFASRREQARAAYRTFVAEGRKAPSPWPRLRGQLFFGSEAFVEKMAGRLTEKQQFPEIPRTQRYPSRPPLATLFAGSADKADRNARIAQAHVAHGYTLQEIAAHLGLHYTTVSKALTRADRKN